NPNQYYILVGDHSDSVPQDAFTYNQFSLIAYKPGVGQAWIKTVGFGYREDDYARAALQQPDGSILAAGSTDSPTHPSQIPLARLNFADGSLDTATNFSPPNNTGKDWITIPGATSPSIVAMAFQGGGSIIMAGNATVNGQSEILVVRLNTSN